MLRFSLKILTIAIFEISILYPKGNYEIQNATIRLKTKYIVC